MFSRGFRRYKRSLQIVLRHPAVTLGVLMATIVATLVFFRPVPKGFFPVQDNGTVFGGMQGPAGRVVSGDATAALRIMTRSKLIRPLAAS